MSESKVEITQKLLLSGMFRLTKTDEHGNSEVVADWFPNEILNSGLNRWGTGAIITGCRVGTDGTAVDQVNQSNLLGHHARTSTTSNENVTTFGTGTGPDPYYMGWRQSWTFPVGAITGVPLAEVGIDFGFINGVDGQCWSRALIKNNLGAPTTLTVQATESLTVDYQLRMYIPTADVVASVDGYTCTLRANNCTNTSYWMPTGAYTFNRAVNMDSVVNKAKMYTGTIGDINAAPSGTSTNATTVSTAAYSNGTYQKSGTAMWNAAAVVAGNSVQSVVIPWSMGSFQIGFSPAIPKDNTKTLSITTTVQWGRYP